MKSIDNFNKPYGLLINLSPCPLGVDLNPKFSWILDSSKKNDHQTAYRIIISDNKEKINSNHGNIWDSGIVYSNESSNIFYAGNALLPDKTYYWKVCTFDKDNKQSEFSDPQKFTTLIKEWKAKPIWCENDADMVFIRKEFAITKDVESAIASVFASSTVTARQYVFDFRVNGKFIGQGPVKPHNNKYFYNTYDITDEIKKGTNCIGSILFTRKDKVYMCQLTITYTDGTVERIGTDKTWLAMDARDVFGMTRSIGTALYFYPSEDINANLYPFGFDKANFKSDSFTCAAEKQFNHQLYPTYTTKVDRFYKHAQSVVNLGENEYFIDLGKEVIGGLKLLIDVPKSYANQTIRILYGEELEDENQVRHKMRTSNTYEEFWTLKEGYQEIENFGMKAFRYVNIQNCPIQLTTRNIMGVAYCQHYDANDSSFESSNSLLNDIYDFVKYSIAATSQDLYVDSQTRERKNYEGDAYINQLSQYALMRNFTLPRFSIEDLVHCPTWPFEYKQMTIMMALNDYLHTGDKGLLEAHYDILKTKVADGNNDPDNYFDESLGLVFNTTKNNSENANLVDWPMSERDNYDFSNAYYNTVTNAFHCKAYKDLAQIAKILGVCEDVEKYKKYAEKIQEGMYQHLIDEKTGLFVDGLDKSGRKLSHISQHANIFPLALGVVKDEETMERIVKFIDTRGMATSVYGAHFVLAACYMANAGQTALNLLTSRKTRSWYHMIYKLNATICTEAWDPANKPNMTYSHPWSSAPANAIAYGMFGIKPTTPGFKTFDIKLQPGDLEYVKIKVPTIKGHIEIEYNLNVYADNKTEICINAKIPGNSTARVFIPSKVEESDVLLDGMETDKKYEKGFFVIDNIGSGKHYIVVKN
ncbi:MAG: family 78 glycoside hydrolase catalytic domain [Clostridiaceae bacterium]|nr:family 78 glycoside hydrolase catalytic domain [Clostridiaceae bacterium]